jgi:hypothetical protein
MVRQNVQGLLEETFRIIDEDLVGEMPVREIKPLIVLTQ